MVVPKTIFKNFLDIKNHKIALQFGHSREIESAEAFYDKYKDLIFKWW